MWVFIDWFFNVWSHSLSLLNCIFISNDQRCILKWCHCSNQFLSHIPGCFRPRIDQIRHSKAQVVQFLQPQTHRRTGVVNFGRCSSGCHFPRQHRQSFGSRWLQMRSGGATSLSQSLLSSAVLPLALLWPWGKLGDGTLGSSPFTPVYRMPIRRLPISF